MVEKRVLDKILAKALKKNEHIKWIFLIDNEGFPISHAVHAKEYRINPQQWASILRFLFTPASMFNSALHLGEPLVGMTFFKEDILIEINVGNGLLGIMHRVVGWPLDADEILALLTELKIYLPELAYSPTGLLKELKAQLGGVKRNPITQTEIEHINKIFLGLMQGKIIDKAYTITNSDQQYYIDLGTNIAKSENVEDLIIITNEHDAQHIYEHKGASAWLGNATKLLVNSYSAGLKKANMTEATFHVYFFNTNQAVVTAPISQHDQVGVYATIRVKNWTDGFINVISPLYQTLLTLVPAAPSPLTTKLKETFDFFSATAEQLKQSIEKFLTEGDSQRAINYMERCAKLFMGQGNFIVAGDYYKWAGYTNFESGNMEKSAAFYNKAIDMHRRGGDQQKVVEDYSDLASVLESFAKTREALENYAEALKLAKQLGNAEVEAEVNENINRVITPIANEMQDYINKDSASSHQLSRLAQRFDLPEHLVILTLEFLIKNQLIMGYVDTNSRMYTKRKEALPELKQEQVVQSVPTGQVPTGTGGGQPIFIAGLIAPRDVPQYNYQFAADQVQKIQADNSRTNSELTKIETEFKRKNVKITDFLKYQTYLNKKKLNDQQLMIYDNMLKLNADNGQPILCFVCLNTIESDDVVSVCPNGHGAHDNCLATWIQTQQKCPVCSEKIMPFMLQLTYAKYSNAIFNPGYVIGLQKEVESLNERLKFLNTLDKNNLDLFNKATAEREDKRQLEKLLNRKEQEIEELKNMMNSYKNQLSRRSSDDDFY